MKVALFSRGCGCEVTQSVCGQWGGCVLCQPKTSALIFPGIQQFHSHEHEILDIAGDYRHAVRQGRCRDQGIPV